VLVLLLDGALWLAIAGAVLALHGLLLPDSHWVYVTSGCTTLGLADVAGALALGLLLTSAD
jgi:hypothetical protein